MAALKFVSNGLMRFGNVRFSSSCPAKKALVLGAYNEGGGCYKLTTVADFYDHNNCGILKKNLEVANLKPGKSRIIFNPSPDYVAVAVVGLGKESACFNPTERIDERKENVRIAAAAGAKSLQELDVDQIELEQLGDAEACAEGATLAVWSYQEWKQRQNRKIIPDIRPFKLCDKREWDAGIIKAEAQNLVRSLAEAPGNFMTPRKFAQCATDELSCHGVEVCVYDEDWALHKNMGAFLSVAKGSCEPLRFLEMRYMCGLGQTIVLVGKGITFDSGGISIKSANKMDEMRADMAGAACVLGVIKAIAQLKLPLNVIGLTPLCENLPSGKAVKPGDIIQAMNRKYIQVDNTDAEGRLILADALCYAATFQPTLTVDVATLTGAMRVALGGVMTGVFSNCDIYWQYLEQAGQVTGDRMWRFPLVKEYSKRVTEFPAVDVNNVGKGTGGGACTAAAFLKEFAPQGGWMHLDIAGVMGPEPELSTPYLSKGSSGRPTRTLIQFLCELPPSCC